MSSLGSRLRQLRGNRKQSDISKALGIGSSSYTMYENDQRQPNYDMLCKIADFYNVSTDYLLCRTDCKSPDIDMQAICKKTGLTDNAVKMLAELKENDVIYNSEEDDPEKEEWFEDWAKRKESFFKFLNILLSWSMFENLADLSENIQKRIDASNNRHLIMSDEFKNIMESIPDKYKNYFLLPFEYEAFEDQEAQRNLREIGENIYRILKYGSYWTPDGRYLEPHAFDRVMRGLKYDD